MTGTEDTFTFTPTHTHVRMIIWSTKSCNAIFLCVYLKMQDSDPLSLVLQHRHRRSFLPLISSLLSNPFEYYYQIISPRVSLPNLHHLQATFLTDYKSMSTDSESNWDGMMSRIIITNQYKDRPGFSWRLRTCLTPASSSTVVLDLSCSSVTRDGASAAQSLQEPHTGSYHTHQHELTQSHRRHEMQFLEKDAQSRHTAEFCIQNESCTWLAGCNMFRT